jgi:hypothetical protein
MWETVYGEAQSHPPNHNSYAKFVGIDPPQEPRYFVHTIFNSYVSFIKPNDSNVNT